MDDVNEVFLSPGILKEKNQSGLRKIFWATFLVILGACFLEQVDVSHFLRIPLEFVVSVTWVFPRLYRSHSRYFSVSFLEHLLSVITYQGIRPQMNE